MICIPISAAANDEMRLHISRAAGEPAELYELRLDSLAEAPRVEELIAACDKPVIATCRSLQEGGAFTGDDEARRAILRRAVRAGAAYVDCEPADVYSLAGVGRAIRIVSMHDFQGTPADLEARVAALAATAAEWVKFAVAANSLADNLAVLAATVKCRKPVIGIAMGGAGLITRVLGGSYGSQVTFGGICAGMESAPGQTTARQLAHFYRVDRIHAGTALYGVLGMPGNEAADRICTAANLSFINTGADAVCLPFLVEDPADFLDSIPESLHLSGFVAMEEYREAALDWVGVKDRGAHAPEGTVSLIRAGSEWVVE